MPLAVGSESATSTRFAYLARAQAFPQSVHQAWRAEDGLNKGTPTDAFEQLE